MPTLSEHLHSLLDALQEILLQERQALRARALAGLETLAGRKQALLQEVEQLAASFAPAAPDPSLQQQLAHCAHLNQLNGAIIAACHQQNRRLLEILAGVPAGAATYGAQGRLAPAGSGLKLGRA